MTCPKGFGAGCELPCVLFRVPSSTSPLFSLHPLFSPPCPPFSLPARFHCRAPRHAPTQRCGACPPSPPSNTLFPHLLVHRTVKNERHRVCVFSHSSFPFLLQAKQQHRHRRPAHQHERNSVFVKNTPLEQCLCHDYHRHHHCNYRYR